MPARYGKSWRQNVNWSLPGTASRLRCWPRPDLKALRQARAQAAVVAMQRRAAKLGLDKMTLAEINAEIAATRRERRKKQGGRMASSR
jgi:hypothetical protein